jgi:hypothetical protein
MNREREKKQHKEKRSIEIKHNRDKRSNEIRSVSPSKRPTHLAPAFCLSLLCVLSAFPVALS